MTKPNDEQTVIIIRESVAQSIITDTYTFICLAACIYIGYLLDSQALQWIAGIMFIISLISRSVGYVKTNTYTLAEAKAKLTELENVR